MRTATSGLALVRARDPGDALARLRDDPELRPIAGCTDVFVDVNAGHLEGTRFLDLWPLRDAWGRVEVRGDRLSIGALATYTDVIRSDAVRGWIPTLVEAAISVGGAQIQNRGTIGGNVANASPAGDTPPVFLAADAEVVLASAASVAGSRTTVAASEPAAIAGAGRFTAASTTFEIACAARVPTFR